MQLRDWLEREGLNYAQFGSAIARTGEAVRRYANGDRVPDRTTMQKICKETGGKVMPNDFYGVGHMSTRIGCPTHSSPNAVLKNIGEAA